MGTRFLRTAISLLILSGCAAAVPELKPPPEGLAWSPEAPFRNQRKTEIPSEAQAFSHFLKGYALLGDGDFVHAPRPGKRVRVESINNPYWRARFSGARRLDPPSGD